MPAGFDPTRRPGLILYFHGWMGCAAAAFAHEDTPCSPDGPPRRGEDLAGQLDAAGVNALLIALEVRPDMPTGEPGRLAMPGGLRAMLRELFSGPLAPLAPLEVDALDRVVVIAHSGGYQAAASALAWGEVPRISEVDLLDSLYGAESIFSAWIRSQAGRFDSGGADPLRFVDLYTCCGGTTAQSRALALEARTALGAVGLTAALDDDDGTAELDPAALAYGVVFKRVPRGHSELPEAYFGELVRAAGFAPTAFPSRAPPPTRSD